MKNLVLFFAALMFLANTITVSAWATPCIQDAGLGVSQNMQDSMEEAMPCHENQQKVPVTHCDGLCLCVHALTSQTFTFHNADGLVMPVFQTERRVITHDDISTRTIKPLLKPPISSS